MLVDVLALRCSGSAMTLRCDVLALLGLTGFRCYVCKIPA